MEVSLPVWTVTSKMWAMIMANLGSDGQLQNDVKDVDNDNG